MGISPDWDSSSTSLSDNPDLQRQSLHEVLSTQLGQQTANQHNELTAGTRCQCETVTNSKSFWALQVKHQLSNIYPWCWRREKTQDFPQWPSLGSCYPTSAGLSQNLKEPAFIKPKLGLADHGQAADVTGPKRFQYDLLHILNSHHFSKRHFFPSFFSGTFLLIGRKST